MNLCAEVNASARLPIYAFPSTIPHPQLFCTKYYIIHTFHERRRAILIPCLKLPGRNMTTFQALTRLLTSTRPPSLLKTFPRFKLQLWFSESDSDEDDEDAEHSTIRHQRLQTEQARNRFQPSRIDAQGVDFSDNVTAQKPFIPHINAASGEDEARYSATTAMKRKRLLQGSYCA